MAPGPGFAEDKFSIDEGRGVLGSTSDYQALDSHMENKAQIPAGSVCSWRPNTVRPTADRAQEVSQVTGVAQASAGRGLGMGSPRVTRLYGYSFYLQAREYYLQKPHNILHLQDCFRYTPLELGTSEKTHLTYKVHLFLLLSVIHIMKQ